MEEGKGGGRDVEVEECVEMLRDRWRVGGIAGEVEKEVEKWRKGWRCDVEEQVDR